MHPLHHTTPLQFTLQGFTTHTLRSETSRSARHGNQDTPVPQLARSGPYSHDGEREAQSQITITDHGQLLFESNTTTT